MTRQAQEQHRGQRDDGSVRKNERKPACASRNCRTVCRSCPLPTPLRLTVSRHSKNATSSRFIQRRTCGNCNKGQHTRSVFEPEHKHHPVSSALGMVVENLVSEPFSVIQGRLPRRLPANSRGLCGLWTLFFFTRKLWRLPVPTISAPKSMPFGK